MKINFDGTINIPTIISIVSALITGTAIIVSMRGDIKTLKVQTADLTQQVGELRRLQFQLSEKSKTHELQLKSIEDLPKKTMPQTKSIKKAQ